MSKKKFEKKVVECAKPLFVSNFAHTGEGVATDTDGRKIFLWNALPGEEVIEYELVRKKAHMNFGIATRLAKKSAERVEPKDAQYLSTSPWQILSEKAEARAKKELLAEIFRDVYTDEIKFTDADSYYFYRNKMEYSLYYDIEKQKIFPAVHARGTHRKMPVFGSSIERPEIFARVQEIVGELNARGEEARKYQSMVLRCNQKGEVSGGLYENRKPHPVFENLRDELCGQEYSYSPNGFFQINLPVYEKVLTRISGFVGEAEKVLDLYAGVGTIGLTVAREKELTLVEVDKSAFYELSKNCEGARGARPVLAKAEEALEYITRDAVVILDPPRAGCDRKLIEKLLEVQPKKIIYLSCNPVTQARDVGMLGEKYKLDLLEGFNFFPRTPHIESLVSLSLV